MDTLTHYKNLVNKTGKETTIPWSTINNDISSDGGPSLDNEQFSKIYNDASSPLHAKLTNIIKADKDSFDQYGIKLVPDNQPVDVANNQQAIDTEHPIIKQTAMSQLKREK